MPFIYNNILKLLRFIKIYGLRRSLAKAFGRLRPNFKLWMILKFPLYNFKGTTIGLVGCGHHAYSSIAYFLTSYTNSKITLAIDINDQAAYSLGYAYKVDMRSDKPNFGEEEILPPEIIYISSNHATHTEYAIKYLDLGCDVFIEKPVSTSFEQLEALSDVVEKSKNKVFVGYNRPHSKSMDIIKKNLSSTAKPFTLSCFVSGHVLSDNHWYRDSAEGTRVVSNLSHWIDLGVYIMHFANRLPEYIDVRVSYSDLDTPSENVSITIVTSSNDLISIVFTCRGEPFEGVNETINFQQDDFIAKIDDFRNTQIWKGPIYKKYKHWPKDNGHKSAILQPFVKKEPRSWEEIKKSTRLMLHIEEMVKQRVISDRFTL